MVVPTPARFCCRNNGSAFGLLVTGLFLLLPACQSSPTDGYSVTFTIDMRTEIAEGRFRPVQDSLGVRGSIPPLSWGASISLGDADGDSVYTGRVLFPRPGTVDYKLKIDSESGDANAGWESGRNRRLVVRADTIVQVERRFDEPMTDLPSTLQENVEVLPPFESAYGLPDRPLAVYLPPGYADDDTTWYPVLYLHDGQNVFDQVGVGTEWEVDEAANRLIDSGAIRPVIIVAIGNTGNRMSEYTPVPGPDGQGGDAAAYAALLTDEIMPYIEARYRVRHGPESTAVGGSSLGGLVTLYLMAQHADRFGSGLVVSPSIWWADRAILDDMPEPGPSRRLWVDVGTMEGARMFSDVRLLHDGLLAGGWKTGVSLAYSEVEDAAHSERAWAARVPDMLRFLYGQTVDTEK